jgi:hypothetical protein
VGGVGGGVSWVNGSSETKANLAQLGLELGLSLAIKHGLNIYISRYLTLCFEMLVSTKAQLGLSNKYAPNFARFFVVLFLQP